jgi:hypothetical protein
MYATIFFLLFF